MIPSADSFPEALPIGRFATLLEGRQSARGAAGERRFLSGSPALDRWLPDRGFRPGSLVEWIAATPGCGASLLALAAVRERQRAGGVAAVIDRGRKFYPPAAAAWGIDLATTLVIRPKNHSDELWAIDQALRSRQLAAVIAWPETIDSYAFRRLQLAVEESGTLGLLVRNASARREPTWAHVRLNVDSQAAATGEDWRLHVELLRCRGGFARGDVQLQIDPQTGEIDEAHAGNLAAELAAATIDSQTA
ncbi:hypothetical protein OAS39_10085 [Pirellulales bacterium]|nr:hypothetical protein [Pirellulales bacterium]